jgi:uncharacterized OsmC-like protein/predicted DsbA family dithiol-disulfide isomerase
MGYFDSAHPTLLADPVTDRDHVRGAPGGRITLVEYGDFSCPYCALAHVIVKALLERFDDLRFVFRANPRSHFFPHAQLAAEAAEAAAVQGKFWEMHDLLFENQATLSPETIVPLAARLQLDLARFEAELAGGLHRPTVHAQEISGWHSHVLSTPTFFLDGVRFDEAPGVLPTAIAQVMQKTAQARAVFREVHVASTPARRQQTISVGPHQLTSDLPASEDGADAGPSPYDLLLAALGSCTAMTLQWMADKHQLPLRKVDVRLSQSRAASGHVFRRSITLEGDLTEEQRAQLLRGAERCPVALTLKGEISIDTRLA